MGRKESGEPPSMGATVAECGRSLSAWSGVQHTRAEAVSPGWVEGRRFRQVGAGWPKSLYFVCAAWTRARSCFTVGQPFTARSS